MNSISVSLFAAAATLALASPALAQRSYTFGMIAKSQGNPFFEAAHAGANDAAKELGAKYQLTIKIDWRTPNEEDAQNDSSDPGSGHWGGSLRKLFLNTSGVT